MQNGDGVGPAPISGLSGPTQPGDGDPPTQNGDANAPVPPPPPPPPPTTSPTRGGRPPRSPAPAAVHHRGPSSQSQISEVSLDVPPTAAAPWDSKAVASVLEELSAGGDSSTPASPKSNRKLTLADVNEASPMEAEAETLLLQALEEKDKEKKPDMQASVLPHVTEAGLDAFEAEPVEASIPSSSPDQRASFQAAADQARASTTGTKGKLIGLAIAMRMLQKDTSTKGEGAAAADQPEEDKKEQQPQPKEQKVPSSDTDTFLQNADALFRRSSSAKREEEIKQSLSAGNDGSTTSNADVEEGGSGSPTSGSSDSHEQSRFARKARDVMTGAGQGVKNEIGVFGDFMEPRKASALAFCKWELVVFILPLTVLALILFYGTGNPMLRNTGASVSWLCLFLVRNIITFTLAKATQVIVIDYWSLRKRWTSRIFGPGFALLVVQSRGYPCISFFYGFYSVILLSGYGDFSKWWLFYQDAIKICNPTNPAGQISESTIYVAVLGCFLLYGAAVSIKRFWLGLRLGKKAYNTYGDKVVAIMHKILLVSEIATLSLTKPSSIYDGADEFDMELSVDTKQTPAVSDPSLRGSKYYKSLNHSQKQMIMQHLDAWEEPVIAKKSESDASISAILQFKQALSLVDNQYPFSVAFGRADNRGNCIESSQKVYDRLVRRQMSGEVLHFNSIAEIAMNSDGTMNEDKIKELVHMFRPSRDGVLTMIDFLKSIDSVYKEFRLLQASIENAGTVDRAFELMVNWAFYIVLWVIMLYIVGLDPMAMFLSISSFIIGFAFMIGNASSQYFSGLLFMLVRRPYDIGDRIHISDPEKDTDGNGSMTWFVEDLGLYATTVRLAATNEVATYSNGALANSRIINANRSPQAVVSVLSKFGVNVPFSKIQLFKKATEKFIKERPREWLSLLGFRATRVQQDQGFIEYVVVLQHRESWQNIGAILNSKAEVTSFTLEVAKQLEMRYDAPPLPVSLTVASSGKPSTNAEAQADSDEVTPFGELFHQTVQHTGAGVIGGRDDGDDE